MEPDINSPYAKGGAKPVPEVSFNGVSLVYGTDFTLAYANNKAVTAVTTVKLPLLTIKFKGNYNGNKQ